MKNLTVFGVILACALAPLFFNTMGNGAIAMSKAPDKASTFKDSKGWNKIDLRLRQAWLESEEKGEGDAHLECILKASSKITDDEKMALSDAGFKYRTVIGQIVTGGLKAKDLPSVANLEFVQAMELAVPLSLKRSAKDQVTNPK